MSGEAADFQGTDGNHGHAKPDELHRSFIHCIPRMVKEMSKSMKVDCAR